MFYSCSVYLLHTNRIQITLICLSYSMRFDVEWCGELVGQCSEVLDFCNCSKMCKIYFDLARLRAPLSNQFLRSRIFAVMIVLISIVLYYPSFAHLTPARVGHIAAIYSAMLAHCLQYLDSALLNIHSLLR